MSLKLRPRKMAKNYIRKPETDHINLKSFYLIVLMSKNIAGIILLVLTILNFNFVIAEEYYISTDGDDRNSGTLQSPWNTINKANQILQPGDTVYLRQGRYQETIAPMHDGTKEAQIVYSGYPNEVVVIHSRPNGAYLSGRSYIYIQKLHFENCNYFIRSYPDGFDYCIIKDCIMKGQTGWCGIEIGDGCTYNKILNNYIDSAGIEGDCIHIGKDEIGEMFGAQYNLVANNECFGAMHGGICCAGDKTQFNIIRNNYVHDIGDNTIATGAFARWTLIEGNRIYNPGTDKDGASAMQIRSENNIIRHNIMSRDFDQDIDKGAAAVVLQSTDEFPFVRNNKIYHNVIYNFNQTNTQWHGVNLAGFNADIQFGPNVFKNNIFYKNGIGNINGYQIAYTRSTKTAPIDLFDGNLICREKADEKVIYFFEYNRELLTLKQAKQLYPKIFLSSNIDTSPLFVDEQNYEFHLQRSSPCVDAGAFLTKTTSPGNGNDIQVEDAGFFCDGWGIVEGDMIKVGSRPPRQIINIDYTNNLITINQPIDWQQNEPVSLNYSGSAPDIGAHEYHITGDALAPDPPQNIKVSNSLSTLPN
jgi:hypothetical protein